MFHYKCYIPKFRYGARAYVKNERCVFLVNKARAINKVPTQRRSLRFLAVLACIK